MNHGWRCPCDPCRATKREKARKYYAANREKILAYQREWQAAHREEYAAQQSAWRARNPGYQNRRRRERRELLRAGAIEAKHGTVNTYTNYMCRCDACRDAMNDRPNARGNPVTRQAWVRANRDRRLEQQRQRRVEVAVDLAMVRCLREAGVL